MPRWPEPWQPTPLMARRMRIWQKGCEAGLTKAEIAAEMGIDRRHLTTLVRYGRERGMRNAFAEPTGDYRPREKVAQRLRRWRQLCALGWTTQEIADELRVDIKTLQRCVIRARQRGHRDAVKHPNAESRDNWAALAGHASARRGRTWRDGHAAA